MPRTETRRRTSTSTSTRPSTRAVEIARKKNRERIRALRAARKRLPLKCYKIVLIQGEPLTYFGSEALITTDGTLAIVNNGVAKVYISRVAWRYVDISEADHTAFVRVEDPEPTEEAVPA